MITINKKSIVENLSYKPESILQAQDEKRRLLDFMPKIDLKNPQDLEIADSWCKWLSYKNTPCATVCITKSVASMITIDENFA